MSTETEFYHNNGFVVLKGVLDERLLSQMREAFDLASAGETPADWPVKFRADKFMQLYEPARLLLKSAQTEWRQMLETLGTRIVSLRAKVHGDQLFYRPPKCSIGTPFHQDAAYFSHFDAEKLRPQYMTAWVPLRDVSASQSCLEIIPSSHLGGLVRFRPHSKGESPFQDGHIESEADVSKAVALPVAYGSVILFDGLLLHGSGANESELPRISVSTHFSVG